MAKVIGQSGAWKFVSNRMDTLGLRAESISEISHILTLEKERLVREEKKKEKLLAKEEQRFSQNLKDLDESYQNAILSAKEKIEQNANIIYLRIQSLKKPAPFFKKIKQRLQLYLET